MAALLGSVIAPLSHLEQLPSFALEARYPAQRTDRSWDELLEALLPSGERQGPEIPAIEPEQVEGGISQATPTPHELPTRE